MYIGTNSGRESGNTPMSCTYHGVYTIVGNYMNTLMLCTYHGVYTIVGNYMIGKLVAI